MGYGINIVHTEDKKKDNAVLVSIPPEKQVGSNICISEGKIFAEFSITYNYSEYFYEAFGKDGIRSIYNKNLKEVLSKINKAIDYLISTYYPDRKYRNSKDEDNFKLEELDYWKSCPFNVVKQLDYMRTVIMLVLEEDGNEDCVLKGD